MESHNGGGPRPKTERLTMTRKQLISKFKIIAAKERINQINDTWKYGLLGVIRREEQSDRVTLADVNRWIKNHKWISAPVEDPPVNHTEYHPPPTPYVPPPPPPEVEVYPEDLVVHGPGEPDDDNDIHDDGNPGPGRDDGVNEDTAEEDELTIEDPYQAQLADGSVAYTLEQPHDNSYTHGQSVLMHVSHTEEVPATHQNETPSPPNIYGYGGQQQPNINDMNMPNQFQQPVFMPHPQYFVPQLSNPNQYTWYPQLQPMLYPQQFLWNPQPQPTEAEPPGTESAPPTPTDQERIDSFAQDVKTAMVNITDVQKYFAKHHGQDSEGRKRCGMTLRHLRHAYEDILKEGTVSYQDLRPCREYKREVIADLPNIQEDPGIN